MHHRLIFTLILFMLADSVFSQNTQDKKPKHTKLYKRKARTDLTNVSYTFRLPSMDKSFVQIVPNVYACQREVTNYDYLLFVNYLKNIKKVSDKDLIRYYPDENVWYDYNNRLSGNMDSNLKAMDEYYGSHPLFDEFPVVGISIEAMEEYCRWLSENSTINSTKKVVYRLPLHQEWMIVKSQFEIKYHAKGNDTIPNCNIKSYIPITPEKKDTSAFVHYFSDGFMFTSPACSFPPDTIGLYDIIGNVWEVVKLDKEYKIIGGCWDSFPNDCNISDFKENQPTIGFRVFMQVLEP